ncbi:MAG: NAD-dependent epimerase/dehydratase family protein [Magnetococcales bacterium]|nr:NAD-dependent epimerase/dehydratase family protein [Magnetococcales bacterium]
MRVLILGGDGYLGWPTAMNLTASGHEVAVADNYLRRRLAQEEDVEPLFSPPNLFRRVELWREISGHSIKPYIGDLCDWSVMETIFRTFRPEAVVHYAEQPSAPYSMLNRRAASLTLSNNLGVTSNLIFAVREFAPEAHIVKLGSMGEYGTPNIDIEEGWIDIRRNGREDRFLYPRQAGSLYHTTKIMDTDLLWFYVRMWDLRVTDLMQGPVYGIVTRETEENEDLLPFYFYDEIFGTVLNRFVVQAVAGHPLTVYGRGEQTRGYLNIVDTLDCVRLSLENPADRGQLRVFNQFTETFSVNELASRVVRAGKALGLNVGVTPVSNPRKEKEEHYYNPKHSHLLELGLKPHLLTDEVVTGMMQRVLRHRHAIRHKAIIRGVKWA